MVNKNIGLSGNMKDVKKVIKVDRVGPVQIPGGPIKCFRAPCPGGIPLPGPTRTKIGTKAGRTIPSIPAPRTNPKNARKLKDIFG